MNKYLVLSALLLIAGAGLVGYHYGKGNREVVIEEKIIKGEKEVVTVEKTIIKERIIRPDGTIEERTIEKDKEKNTTETEISRDTSTHSRPLLAKYSLGIGFEKKLTLEELRFDKSQVEDYYISAGYRVFGPAWVDMQYQPSNRSVSLGVRIEL